MSKCKVTPFTYVTNFKILLAVHFSFTIQKLVQDEDVSVLHFIHDWRFAERMTFMLPPTAALDSSIVLISRHDALHHYLLVSLRVPDLLEDGRGQTKMSEGLP